MASAVNGGYRLVRIGSRLILAENDVLASALADWLDDVSSIRGCSRLIHCEQVVQLSHVGNVVGMMPRCCAFAVQQ
ncbi:hypothetical protein N7523_000742 [Penicillium sp. IBT 18751x]|nr:hypothetical protein N7523_000742 [Penicillium sp. IBT 18751x]